MKLRRKRWKENKKIYKGISKENKILYYIILAEVEVNDGDFKYAYECCEKAYNLIKEINCWVYECEVLSIRAVANYKMGILQEAEKDFISAIENAKIFNNEVFVVKTLRKFSNYYYSIGDYNQSVNKLMEACNEIKKISSPLDESALYYDLSEAYARSNEMDKAYKYLKMHLEVEKNIFNNIGYYSYKSLLLFGLFIKVWLAYSYKLLAYVYEMDSAYSVN